MSENRSHSEQNHSDESIAERVSRLEADPRLNAEELYTLYGHELDLISAQAQDEQDQDHLDLLQAAYEQLLEKRRNITSYFSKVDMRRPENWRGEFQRRILENEIDPFF